MHATLVVLIDREREELKNSNNDATAISDFSISYGNANLRTETNSFIKAYQVD